MENTNSNADEEEIIFKAELIDILARFGNEYEESLAMVLKNEDALDIINQNFIEKDFDENKNFDILSLWEKLRKNNK